jgi:protein-disulfide isomerase
VARRLAAALFAYVFSAALAVLPTLVGAQAVNGVNLTGVGHDRGRPGADVLIVEFADFGCSYCARFIKETYQSLDSAYIRPGRVEWKYVPFVTGNFRNSREVTEAAECAADQNAFWPMHDLLYARRKDWMTSKDIGGMLARYAQELGLSPTRFSHCIRTRATRERVAKNDVLASTLFIRGTPTFFVNRYTIPGAVPFDLFRQVIEAASR